ncbi:MAG: TetR/AcrR family transcriptional regulator [Actinobacteria bacterium]|nr:TetR/AcrR family transcriptional regulator [Actinomycetota bacterium]
MPSRARDGLDVSERDDLDVSESETAAVSGHTDATRVRQEPGQHLRLRGERKSTPERRAEIVRAAAKTFGTKGYQKGSLIDIAAQVGMTHAGVLHHFGSKEQLLIAVLEYRDQEDLEVLAKQRMPEGIDLFWHLTRTAAANADRAGIVQTYAAITGESVTENHPARGFVIHRFEVLRGKIEEALREVCGPDLPEDVCTHAASSIIGVMDGIQLQWLLDGDAVDLPEATRFAIEAILTAAISGVNRPRPLTPGC